MKISDLSIQLVSWPQSSGRESTLGVVRVETNTGLVGHSFLGTNWRGAHFDTPYLLEVIKPLVLGRNPLDSEAIWQETRQARRASASASHVPEAFTQRTFQSLNDAILPRR